MSSVITWVLANYQTYCLDALILAEAVSFILPGTSGTLSGVIKALLGTGVKDPGIGGK